MATRALRSPSAVTLSVWRALLLREAASRLARDPLTWVRVFAEPIGHIALLMTLFIVGFRQRTIAGGDAVVFIMLGVLVFFIPRNMVNRSIGVVDRSEALYTYRQVQPVDTVIARAVLESVLAVTVFAIVWTGAFLYELPVVPADPLLAILAASALWLAGLGLTLVVSVVSALSGIGASLGRMLRGPLYMLSAIIHPSYMVPMPARDVLLYNPFVHGVELFRVAFMPHYRVPPNLDLMYLVKFGVVMVFLGLALHVRYQDALRAR
jgi:capsular polysaccharide transport system permease protein